MKSLTSTLLGVAVLCGCERSATEQYETYTITNKDGSIGVVVYKTESWISNNVINVEFDELHISRPTNGYGFRTYIDNRPGPNDVALHSTNMYDAVRAKEHYADHVIWYNRDEQPIITISNKMLNFFGREYIQFTDEEWRQITNTLLMQLHSPSYN